MKSRRLMEALTGIDPKFIQEGEYAVPEKAPQKTRPLRRVAVVLLAACLVFALALGAYAADLFGIRTLFETPYVSIPEEAVPYIQPETAEKASEGWSCKITESLCDYATAMVTVTVSGGDQYIVAPTDCGPGDRVGMIGLSGNQTLEEYAASHGKKLLFAGASLTQIGGEPTGNGSMRMENLSESEMVILSECSKTVSAPTLDAICMVTAQEAGSKDVQRVELPFTLTEAPADAEGESIYHPLNPSEIPGMTVGDLHVTQTPLGLNLRMRETVTDKDAYYDIMKYEIDGLTLGEYGAILEEDGNYYFTANMCQGTLSDIFVIHVYDCNKDPLGEIEFRKFIGE